MSNIRERLSCTAIVCAYNEEGTLGRVLASLLESPFIDEIIIIDDGSEDATPAILQSFNHQEKIHAVLFPENRGKGRAMVEGILHAHGEILLFVDADLLNFNTSYILPLLQPLQEGSADMVIGYPVRKQDWGSKFMPLQRLSGERALYHHDVLPIVPRIDASGYGVETLINLHYRREKKCVQMVPLHGLIHPIKAEKAGPAKAVRMYTEEALQIVRSVAYHYPLVLAAYGLDGSVIPWTKSN